MLNANVQEDFCSWRAAEGARTGRWGAHSSGGTAPRTPAGTVAHILNDAPCPPCSSAAAGVSDIGEADRGVPAWRQRSRIDVLLAACMRVRRSGGIPSASFFCADNHKPLPAPLPNPCGAAARRSLLAKPAGQCNPNACVPDCTCPDPKHLCDPRDGKCKLRCNQETCPSPCYMCCGQVRSGAGRAWALPAGSCRMRRGPRGARPQRAMRRPSRICLYYFFLLVFFPPCPLAELHPRPRPGQRPVLQWRRLCQPRHLRRQGPVRRALHRLRGRLSALVRGGAGCP